MKDENNVENTSWGNVRVDDEIGKNEKWMTAYFKSKYLSDAKYWVKCRNDLMQNAETQV